MTLGAFTGYFRKRESNKNTLYPYGSYSGHFVLGVIYTKSEGSINERERFDIKDLEKIKSVIREFTFFAQPKYRIASANPGSGNTKNIGSVSAIDALVEGEGPFAALGEEVYNDYWMYYLTADMARYAEMERPYTNLKSYQSYKSRGVEILEAHKEEIQNLAEEEGATGETDTEEIE